VTALQRAEGVVYDLVDGCAVLVDPAGVQLVTLNEVGALVWESLADGGDAPSIVAALRERFPDVPAEQIQRDTASFLDELRDAGLVVERA
jgi:hypothetical protein